MASTDDSALALFAAYRQLVRAERQFRAVLDAASRANDVTRPDAMLLLYLMHADCGDAGGIIQKELADELTISTAQASSRLEALRQRSLVASIRGQGDRRKQFWSLTTAGRQLAHGLQATLSDAIEDSAAKALVAVIQDTNQAAEPLPPRQHHSREAA
jgi:DNA-binding MarR family transcriptional regulator